MKTKITILGDGAWGTTLAILLSKNHDVLMWSNFPDYLKVLESKRENIKYLPGVKIPENIRFETDIKKSVEYGEIVVLAIPSKFFREVIRKIKKGENKPPLKQKIFLSVAKGIERGTLKRMSEVARDELGKIKIAVLSGPTIAQELARGMPAVAVIASKNIKTAQFLQEIFSTKNFRLYTSSDIIGVELGGATKNIIAIAAGISDGLGFGANAKAAILSRGIIEMQRLAQKLGAKKKTLFGISGLGDLATTCISLESRNRTFGERLSRGEKVKNIIKSMNSVVEGVTTVEAVYELSKIHNVDMPITNEVYLIIKKGKFPKKALQDLMNRKKKKEDV